MVNLNYLILYMRIKADGDYTWLRQYGSDQEWVNYILRRIK